MKISWSLPIKDASCAFAFDAIMVSYTMSLLFVWLILVLGIIP